MANKDLTNVGPGKESPIVRLHAVTPDDDDLLPFVTRALHVTGNGGLIAVVTVQGDHGNIYVPQGGVHAIEVVQVKATGTDATGIRAEA